MRFAVAATALFLSTATIAQAQTISSACTVEPKPGTSASMQARDQQRPEGSGRFKVPGVPASAELAVGITESSGAFVFVGDVGVIDFEAWLHVPGTYSEADVTFELRRNGVLLPNGPRSKARLITYAKPSLFAVRLGAGLQAALGSDLNALGQAVFEYRILSKSKLLTSARFKGADVAAEIRAMQEIWGTLRAAARDGRCKPNRPAF